MWCSPRGAVTFISDSYGGSVSDRQIIERSNLLTDGKFDPGGSIMAHRGIMVQNLFASKDVQVNTLHMLKCQTQMDPETVVASKRIHIVRVIGLGKHLKFYKMT